MTTRQTLSWNDMVMTWTRFLAALLRLARLRLCNELVSNSLHKDVADVRRAQDPTVLGRHHLDIVEPLVRIESVLHRLLAHLRHLVGTGFVAGEREQRAIEFRELGVREGLVHELVDVLRLVLDLL